MLQIAQSNVANEERSGILDMCNDLFKEWLYNLDSEEQKIWLWNASVEMLRIKQRRPRL